LTAPPPPLPCAAIQRGKEGAIHTITPLVALFALALAGCAGGGGDAAPAADHHAAEPTGAPRLTVLTYNIHHAAGADQKVDLPRIARVICALEPDLVALQEVDQNTGRTGGVDEAAELGRFTNLHAAYGPAMDYQGGKYGDAILSRLPIVSSRVIKLPWTQGDRREPRVALAVTCRTDAGQQIVFVSTHLDHTGHSPDRLPQAKAIAEALAAEERPTILAGDFNCGPASPPVRALEETWSIASNGDPSPTCPADEPRSKIDHVLVKPATRWRVVEAKVVDERAASDHRPVLVKLELVPNNAR
jgi:endonuclease/exonuclease/phosphatase family metal-dependent hydrolase